MTEQLVIPPARVWDKIEKILDEQDHLKNKNQAVSTTFGSSIISSDLIYVESAASLNMGAEFL